MQEKTLVLLVNTGSPSAPTARALKPYLEAFLSDQRVIELPRWFWQPILHAFVLRTRPEKSARRYRKIWLPEGSPLIVYTERLVKALRGRFGEHVEVDMAMRIGFPGIERVLQERQAQGFTRFVIFPMFAQYATQTTESVLDAVKDFARKTKKPFNWTSIGAFYRHPLLIEALAEKIARSRTDASTHLLMSFHGIPVKSIRNGSPYEKQCLEMARLLAARLHLPEGGFSVAFQSRFGGDRWLQPYFPDHMRSLLKLGIGRVDVVCLSFSVDCLETLEEIAIEHRDEFLAMGGQSFHYIGCLNDDEAAVRAYESIISEALTGIQ